MTATRTEAERPSSDFIGGRNDGRTTRGRFRRRRPGGGSASGEAVPAPAEAHDLSFDAMAGMTGRLAFASPPGAIDAMFPAASGWLGPRRVAALAATTLLVGMVCPGLHSIYAGLTAEACDEPVPEDRISFWVTATEPRFRSVRMRVAGGGLAGDVQSYVRTPPTPQASVQDLAEAVEPGEFSGATALIIGGSRGLGEVTAKLLAAGGARVALSYRVGGAEAEAVAREIRSPVAYARRSPMTRAFPQSRNWPGSPPGRRTPTISPPRRSFALSQHCSPVRVSTRFSTSTLRDFSVWRRR